MPPLSEHHRPPEQPPCTSALVVTQHQAGDQLGKLIPAGGQDGQAAREFLEGLMDTLPKLREFLNQPNPMKDRTVADIVTLYLADARADLSPDRLANVVFILDQLKAALGARRLADCLPLDMKAWIQGNPGWKSPNTRHTVNGICQRPFNWACKMRIIPMNPFQGAPFPKGDPQREMTEDEYQSLLRVTAAPFRRLLCFMRFTGCRPSEARKAKWDDVDFERNVIRLYQHKTSKTQREKKPRNIVLPAIVQRLLGWIRRNQKENPISVIRDILADGPVPAPEFRELARRRGVSMHDFYKLTRQAGAKCRKTGPVGAGGAWVWELHRPETHGICRFPGRKGFYARICHRGRQIQRKLADDLQTAKRRMRDLLEELGVDPRRVAIGDYVEPAPIDREHIFLNQGGQAWTKWNLSNMMQRGRRRAGLTRAVRLYQVRHHYASELVRANTNLKVIAELLGHTTLTMVSWYCHIAGDLSLLLNAVEDALEARRAARAKIAMSL